MFAKKKKPFPFALGGSKFEVLQVFTILAKFGCEYNIGQNNVMKRFLLMDMKM